MRTVLLLLCAALVGGAPNLLPGDPRLGDPEHQHHGDGHHHDHGGHEAHQTEVSDPAGEEVNYGAGIELTLLSEPREGHYNPFLPQYEPPADLATADLSALGQQTPPQVKRESTGAETFIDADALLSPAGAPVSPADTFIDPADLNRNPGSGNSGPKGPLTAACASGLVCAPEELCDPYTGFVVGTLAGRPPADPSQPTVALQRCVQNQQGPQLQGGVCCRDTVGIIGNAGPSAPVPAPVQPAPVPVQPAPVPVQPAPVPAAPAPGPGTKTGDLTQNPFLPGGGPPSTDPLKRYQQNPFLSGGFGPAPGGQGQGQQVFCAPEERCVDRTQCGDDGYVITDGAGILDVRRPAISYCIGETGSRGTCCRDRPAPQPGSSGSGTSSGTQTEVVCDAAQSCVEPDLCDEEGYLVYTDGAGIINARGQFLTAFCRLASGGKGRCCSPPPDGPTRQEVACDANTEACVAPNLCGDDGSIITDGAGILDPRITSQTYCRDGTGQEGVCCKLLPPTPTTSPPSQSREVTCQGAQECVRQDLCDADGRIVTDGAGLINARFDNKEYCRLADSSKGTCCLPADVPTSPPSTGRREVFCAAAEDCVQPKLCGDDGYIITDGAGLFDIRINSQTFCLDDQRREGLCCLRPPPPTPTEREVTCQAGQECVTADLCDENGHIVTDGVGLIDVRFDNKEYCRVPTGEKGVCCQPPTDPEPPAPTCGQSLQIRILGISPDSTEASFGELPWQTIISYTNYTFICGGSLISKRHVLTAAHCVQGIQPGIMQVRLGEYQVNAENEPLPHQDIPISGVKIHPGYRRGPLFYDLAVIELASDAKLDSHIQPICLPSPGQKFSGRCVASGWGKDAFQGQFSTILKKVRLPMVDNNVCQNNLRRTRLGSFFQLNKSFVCAGGEEGIDSCKGDGGGPLACPVQGVYVLAGVTSWGIGCGTKDVPGVYASAETGLDFIRESVGGAI